MATPNSGPTEQLPGAVPHFVIFHLPHVWGTAFAYLFESIGLEQKLALPSHAHPYAWMGIGFVVLANVASYLSGSVVCARLEYDVKLPNLYANKAENKNAVLFNCIQRGHQNLLENFPQIVRIVTSDEC
jgi:MAPEG family